MKRANYAVIKDSPDMLVINDLDCGGMSVTNDAENVVRELAERLGKRPLYYYDSEGEPAQLLVKDGEFAGFGPALGNMGHFH